VYWKKRAITRGKLEDVESRHLGAAAGFEDNKNILSPISLDEMWRGAKRQLKFAGHLKGAV